MSYVEIKSIQKSFNNIKVLKDIDFSIEKGEFLTLLGPSGCGKSTLLRCIAGLNNFENGSIIIDNKDIGNVKPKDRQVGMVFQSYALFPNMTVYENIAFGLKIKKIPKKEIDKKVKEMIEIVELNGKEDNYITELSGGQQQRVALARSIVTEPKVLLLDEPLSALDAKIRKNLQVQIRKIQKKLNMTTIFVTHDQEEAMTMSDKIIVMNKGYIAQIGGPEEIYKHPANEFVARFIGNYNVYNKIEGKKLLNIKLENSIAIRPEVISISKENDKDKLENYYIKAKVNQKYMVGSIVRYELYKDDIKILVDMLNQDSLISEGSEVYVKIPKKDVIHFNEEDISADKMLAV
ncbi:MAG: ABC transporter ATP-binding protein [Peptostreptococcaceae bacterium]|nr:ABC transporter ATP-binding protein [Peptostreptococcaceae bacterium]